MIFFKLYDLLILLMPSVFVTYVRQLFYQRMIHVKCRNGFYPRTNNTVERFLVPENKVSWDISWPDYRPVNYTAPYIKGQIWADPDISDPSFDPRWNEIDGKVNRKSHIGVYAIENSLPVNPVGRTGICGRGCLGRWGPNHAADPIVTRWKRNERDDIATHPISGKRVLQFVAIERRDSGEWAIPGGMVDPGETVTTTLKREFMEEAINILGRNPEHLTEAHEIIEKFFDHGETIYKGYVDDPRNTDNAWMETVAMNFHDDQGSSVGRLPLCAGDDAVAVRWMDVGKDVNLYASHNDFIAIVALRHGSHW